MPDQKIFGIGTDVTECPRIARMIEKHGDAFLQRIFTDAEIAYCQKNRAHTQHYTGRWCAKEAILKALGTGWSGGILWRDMEILNKPGGAPYVTLKGATAEIAEKMGIAEVLISISHCESVATATAVAIGYA